MSARQESQNVYRDNNPECLSWELGSVRPQVRELIESGKIVPEGRALDLSCGLGANATYLARSGFDTIGMDVSETAVSFACAKAAEEGVGVEFHVASPYDLPFETAVFDLVLDVGCFHHVLPVDRDAYLLGIHRVLKPFARYFTICFSDENGDSWNHFSARGLREAMSPFFEIAEMDEFSSWEGQGPIRHFRTALLVSR